MIEKCQSSSAPGYESGDRSSNLFGRANEIKGLSHQHLEGEPPRVA